MLPLIEEVAWLKNRVSVQDSRTKKEGGKWKKWQADKWLDESSPSSPPPSSCWAGLSSRDEVSLGFPGCERCWSPLQPPRIWHVWIWTIIGMEKTWTWSHLKPLKMCVLFRHGAAQGLLSRVKFTNFITNKKSRDNGVDLRLTSVHKAPLAVPSAPG